MKLWGWVAVVGVCGLWGQFLDLRGLAGSASLAFASDSIPCAKALEGNEIDFRLVGESVGDPFYALLKVKKEFAFLSSLQKAQASSPYGGAFEESLDYVRSTVAEAAANAQKWLQILEEVEDGLFQRQGATYEIFLRGHQTYVAVQTQKNSLKSLVLIPQDTQVASSTTAIRDAARGRLTEALAFAVATEATLKSLNTSLKEHKEGRLSLAHLFFSFDQFLNQDAILPLNASGASAAVDVAALEQTSGFSELRAIAQEMEEMGTSLSLATDKTLPGTKALEKLILIRGMLFRNLPTIQDLRGQGLLLGLVAQDFSGLELDQLESVQWLHRYADNLFVLLSHIALRAETLSVERDERYLNAGLKGLSSLLRKATQIPYGSLPLFEMVVSRRYANAFSEFWIDHYKSTPPLHQVGFSQMIFAVSAIGMARHSDRPVVVLNNVVGEGQVFVKMNYDDGSQVEVVRQGDGLRERPSSFYGAQHHDQGQPYKVAAITSRPDGSGSVLVDTYEERDGVIHLLQRSLQPEDWGTKGLVRSPTALSDLHNLARAGQATFVRPFNNRSN